MHTFTVQVTSPGVNTQVHLQANHIFITLYHRSGSFRMTNFRIEKFSWKPP